MLTGCQFVIYSLPEVGLSYSWFDVTIFFADVLQRLTTMQIWRQTRNRPMPLTCSSVVQQMMARFLTFTAYKKKSKFSSIKKGQRVSNRCKDLFKRKSISLHTAGGREIWIDQSGFSRWEKIHCPHVNVSWQERHGNQATFLIGDCIN